MRSISSSIPHRDDAEAERGGRAHPRGAGPSRRAGGCSTSPAAPAATRARFEAAGRPLRRAGSLGRPCCASRAAVTDAPLVRADMRALPIRPGIAWTSRSTSSPVSATSTTTRSTPAPCGEMVATVRPGGWFVIDFLNAARRARRSGAAGDARRLRRSRGRGRPARFRPTGATSARPSRRRRPAVRRAGPAVRAGARSRRCSAGAGVTVPAALRRLRRRRPSTPARRGRSWSGRRHDPALRRHAARGTRLEPPAPRAGRRRRRRCADAFVPSPTRERRRCAGFGSPAPWPSPRASSRASSPARSTRSTRRSRPRRWRGVLERALGPPGRAGLLGRRRRSRLRRGEPRPPGSRADGALATASLPPRPPDAPLTPMYREPLGRGRRAGAGRARGRPADVRVPRRHPRLAAAALPARGDGRWQPSPAPWPSCSRPLGIAVSRQHPPGRQARGRAAHHAGARAGAPSSTSDLDRRAEALRADGANSGVTVGDGATLVMLEAALGRDRLVASDGGFVTRRSRERFDLADLERIARERADAALAQRAAPTGDRERAAADGGLSRRPGRAALSRAHPAGLRAARRAAPAPDAALVGRAGRAQGGPGAGEVRRRRSTSCWRRPARSRPGWSGRSSRPEVDDGPGRLPRPRSSRATTRIGARRPSDRSDPGAAGAGRAAAGAGRHARISRRSWCSTSSAGRRPSWARSRGRAPPSCPAASRRSGC